jgi:D-aspartate ligase
MNYKTNLSRPSPFLLTTPAAGGSIAAVRQLGSRGIPITIAGNEKLAAARWSGYATQFLRCPSVQDADGFLEWLIAFGRRNPGHVPYPTSDETVWLFASNEAVLKPYFKMYHPPFRAPSKRSTRSDFGTLANARGLTRPQAGSPPMKTRYAHWHHRYPIQFSSSRERMSIGSERIRGSSCIPRMRCYRPIG